MIKEKLFYYIYFFIIIIFIIISLCFFWGWYVLDFSGIMFSGIIFVIFYLSFFLLYDKNQLIKPSSIIIHYTFLLGFGIVIAYIFDSHYVLLQLSRDKFFNGNFLQKYLSLFSIAILSYLIPRLKKKPNILLYNDFSYNKFKYNYLLFNIGFILLFIFGAYLIGNFLLGNIPLGNYTAYKIWAGNRWRNYLQIGYWFSAIFIILGGRKKQILYSLLLYIFISIILFIAGNRNDFLIPLLVGIGLYNLKYKELPKLFLLTIALIVFVGSPILVVYRNTGDFIFLINNMSNYISKAFFELGAQLAPLSNMFKWIEDGESFKYGMTYIYPTYASFFGKIFEDIRTTYTLSQYSITTRLPSLAFSMTGEIYFNFGIIGVIFIYYLIGKNFYMFDKKNKYNFNKTIQYGFYFFLLLFLVRNSFDYSISYLLEFYLLFFIYKVIYAIIRKVKNKI